MYHLSDGIYGAFSCLLFDSPCPRPQLHKVRVWPGLRRPQQVPHLVSRHLTQPYPPLHHGCPTLRAGGERGLWGRGHGGVPGGL